MRPEQIQVMKRLGLISGTEAPLDVFLLWGRLLDDPVLLERQRFLESVDTEWASAIGDAVAALKHFNKQDAAALRARLGIAAKN